MRYTQVRQMLDQVREFHGQLVNYFDHLSAKTEQRRVQMLLEHLSNHEKELQEGLRLYEESASRNVMDTYIDCEYCNEILATCRHTPVAPGASVDSVVKVAMDVDNCLLRFFREVAQHAETESVRDAFKGFINMEEAELRKLAMNALGARDM